MSVSREACQGARCGGAPVRRAPARCAPAPSSAKLLATGYTRIAGHAQDMCAHAEGAAREQVPNHDQTPHVGGCLSGGAGRASMPGNTRASRSSTAMMPSMSATGTCRKKGLRPTSSNRRAPWSRADHALPGPARARGPGPRGEASSAASTCACVRDGSPSDERRCHSDATSEPCQTPLPAQR